MPQFEQIQTNFHDNSTKASASGFPTSTNFMHRRSPTNLFQNDVSLRMTTGTVSKTGMASSEFDVPSKKITRKPTQNSGFGSSLNVNNLIDIDDETQNKLNKTQIHFSGKHYHNNSSVMSPAGQTRYSSIATSPNNLKQILSHLDRNQFNQTNSKFWGETSNEAQKEFIHRKYTKSSIFNSFDKNPAPRSSTQITISRGKKA